MLFLNIKKRRDHRRKRLTSNCIVALLGSVTPQAGFKKCAAGEYFLKEANTATLQLRSPRLWREEDFEPI